MSRQNTRLEFSLKLLSTINLFLIMTSVHLHENVPVGCHPVKSKSIKSRYVPFSNSVKAFLLSNDKFGAKRGSIELGTNKHSGIEPCFRGQYFLS